MAKSKDTGLTSRIDFTVFNIVSYNLHGLNSGRSLLYDLCNDPNNFIIAVQEHWLTPNNLSALNNVHPAFSAYSVSSMSCKLATGIYRGRPFGGVAFLWRKSINDFIRIISSDPEGRSLCVELTARNGHIIRLVNVYFPCFSSSVDYTNELGRCLGCIENNLNGGTDTIILGDMNFTCSDNHAGFLQCCDVFNNFNIFNCDDLCITDDKITYDNASLGQSSFIDHFL